MKPAFNLIDRVVNFFSPAAGTRRLYNRFVQQQASGLIRQYEAAGRGRRTDNWKSTGTSATAEIQPALFVLRNRSRDLVRNNGYGKNAIRKIANNVVGPGIIPNPDISSAPQEKKLKKIWNSWANTTDCDYDGHNTFYGIQKLVMRTVAESGECIIRKRIVADRRLALPLQLQVLEPDYIDTTKYDQALSNGGFIYYGIEFSKSGKIVAYWLFDTHPGETSVRFNLTSTRYPVEEIIHVFEKERPGQFRGVPWLHSSMLRLKDLDEYEDAQLIRQKIAACFSVFITDNTPSIPGMKTTDADRLERVEPGIIEHLKPGQTVSFATPPHAEGFGEYTKNVLRGIAAGIGMDYVTLTGDLSATNFSSGRMGWLEFNRNITEWQWQMLIPMHCDKAWKWFLEMAAIYGHIRAGVVVDVEWTPPRREQINPEVETKAMIEAIQNGVSTWTDVQLEQGFNPEEQLDKMIKDRNAFEKAGLPIYTDKAAMTAKDPTNTNTPEKKNADDNPPA
jgi:lambda family phage portal protein